MPRIVIDLEKCLNSGQCAYMQPEIFQLDDEGNPTLLVETVTSEELIVKAKDAVEMCPGLALSLVDDS